MITPAKLAANRKNALKSTGPRTDPGKAIAARNSVKHGLLSNSPVIPGEKQEEFSAFTEEWLDQIRPFGALECHLAYQIISVIRRYWVGAGVQNLGSVLPSVLLSRTIFGVFSTIQGLESEQFWAVLFRISGFRRRDHRPGSAGGRKPHGSG